MQETAVTTSHISLFTNLFSKSFDNLSGLGKTFLHCQIVIVLAILLGTSVEAANTRYRCMWREDPATTMVIGWDQVSGGNAILYYDITDHGQKTDAYRLSHKPDKVLNARGMSNHFVRLTNLKPATVYYFVIRDSEGVSRRMSFRTAPDNPSERLSIIAGGDSRNHRDARKSANKLVSKLRPHFVLFNGDMTADDSAAEWKKWLDDWQETIGSDGRLFPVLVARGNHEASNESLVEIFDVANSGLIYALNFGGSLLRIYTLNSMIPSGGEQRDWLEADLKNSGQMTWRFAQYHHAMRPHTSDKTEKDELIINWATLFYKYKVQLAIESDSHVAKWTYPIRPSKEPGSDQGFIQDDENGTVYIGEGCWGAPLRKNDDDKAWTRASGSFNQFNWIFVDKDKVEIRTVMTDVSAKVGEVSDRNVFEPPIGLSLWNPPTGDVLVMHREKPVLASKPPVQTTTPATSKTLANTTPAQSISSDNGDDWSTQPKVLCDAAGKAAIRYTLKNTCNVTILLLNESFTVLDRLTFNGQPAKTHLKEITFSNLKNGTYYLVIKGGDDVVGKYQLIR